MDVKRNFQAWLFEGRALGLGVFGFGWGAVCHVCCWHCWLLGAGAPLSVFEGDALSLVFLFFVFPTVCCRVASFPLQFLKDGINDRTDDYGE